MIVFPPFVVLTQGTSILSQLSQALEGRGDGTQEEEEEGAAGFSHELAEHCLMVCVQQLASMFDKEHGGFGGAPKFPRPPQVRDVRFLRQTGLSAGPVGVRMP